MNIEDHFDIAIRSFMASDNSAFVLLRGRQHTSDREWIRLLKCGDKDITKLKTNKQKSERKWKKKSRFKEMKKLDGIAFRKIRTYSSWRVEER